MAKFGKQHFIATFWTTLDQLPEDLLQKLPQNHDEVMLMRPKVQMAVYHMDGRVLIGYHKPGNLGGEMGEERGTVVTRKYLGQLQAVNSMWAEANLIVERQIRQTALIEKITAELAVYNRDPLYRPTHGFDADMPPTAVVLQKIFEHMLDDTPNFRRVKGKFY